MAELLLPGDILSMTARAADRLMGAGNGDAALLYLWLLRRGGRLEPEAARRALKWDVPRLEAALSALVGLGLADGTAAPEAPARMEPEGPPEYTAADIDGLAASARLPLVVKPVASGSSIGVSIAHTAEELRRSLTEGLALGGRTVLEEYIRGREIQVGILEDKALPSIEIIPQADFYDYANKYQPGAAREVCPAEIPPEWEKKVGDAAVAVFEELGLSVYSRADFIVTEDGEAYFLEINTLPGMTPTSLLPQEAAAAGIDYNELCQRIVHASLEARKQGR